jgi:hypothetical protein
VLFSVRDAFFAECAGALGFAGKASNDGDKFVAEYVVAMSQRAAGWPGTSSADDLSKQEFERALRALRVAAYRDAAAEKAKEGVSDNA